MNMLLMIFAFLLSSGCFAQQKVLNEYLNALQTKESTESRNIINRTSFHLTNEYTLYSFEHPEGAYFDTDIPGIKGFRANVLCKAKDELQNLLTDTFLIVMYYDLVEASWKVFDFRTSADACYEAAVSQGEIEKNIFYTDKEFVYRNLGYWQMMCGHIEKAEEAFLLASTEASAKGTKDFVKDHLETIKSIR